MRTPMLAEASEFTGSDARVSWLLSKKEKQRVQGVRVPIRFLLGGVLSLKLKIGPTFLDYFESLVSRRIFRGSKSLIR